MAESERARSKTGPFGRWLWPFPPCWGISLRTTSRSGSGAACAEDGQATAWVQQTAVSVAGRVTKDLAKQYEAHVWGWPLSRPDGRNPILSLLLRRPRIS